MLVPDSLWKALQQWYGGAPALPRQVSCIIQIHDKQCVVLTVVLRIICKANDGVVRAVNAGVQGKGFTLVDENGRV